ncbi:MAG: hypothetical protein JO224_01950 [Pelomonas sp.]|nr:hypothetical protein [Roseateles sp.]
MNARQLMITAVAHARRFGWPGAVGLVALLATAACAAVAQRWDAQTAAQQDRADALRRELHAAQLAQRVAPRAADALTPQDPQTWLAELPAAARRQERLADLLELAIRNGLASPRTDYRLSVDAGIGVEHLRVNMPITGHYAQLRAFVEAALAHDPALSLDSLRLQRNGPQNDQVDAELVWSLHGRAASPGSSATGSKAS